MRAFKFRNYDYEWVTGPNLTQMGQTLTSVYGPLYNFCPNLNQLVIEVSNFNYAYRTRRFELFIVFVDVSTSTFVKNFKKISLFRNLKGI